MVVKKISFILIALAIAIMGTASTPVLAEKSSEEIAKEAVRTSRMERIARRDRMIAGLKAKYEAKLAAKKNVTAEKRVESVENVEEKKVEAVEKLAEIVEKIAESNTEGTEIVVEEEHITIETVAEIKASDETVEVEAESEHETENVESAH